MRILIPIVLILTLTVECFACDFAIQRSPNDIALDPYSGEEVLWLGDIVSEEYKTDADGKFTLTVKFEYIKTKRGPDGGCIEVPSSEKEYFLARIGPSIKKPVKFGDTSNFDGRYYFSILGTVDKVEKDNGYTYVAINWIEWQGKNKEGFKLITTKPDNSLKSGSPKSGAP